MPNEITELQLNLDSYKALSVKRLAQQKIVDNLKKDEYALRDSVIGYLTEHPEVNGVIGSTHKGLLKDSEVMIITNYAQFFKHIKDTNQWDLAQVLKPATEAVRLRREEGEAIPGLQVITIQKLSVTKL